MKSSIFKVQFDDSVKEYNKVDGILAIAYFVYILLFTIFFGLFVFHTNCMEQLFIKSGISSRRAFRFVLYLLVVPIEIGPVFIILKCRKQSVKSIGLKKEKILKCILLGVLFSIPPLLSNVLSMKIGRLLGVTDAFWTFAYFFFEIALVEEIVFRGFIQTRIQGLIRSKWLSIILVGVMFSSMHIPFPVIEYNFSVIYYVQLAAFHLLFAFLIHIYFVYLYTRDNNILAPVVAHAIVDFLPDLFSAM